LDRAKSLGFAFTTSLALDGVALLGALGADLEQATAYAEEARVHNVEHSVADYEQRARFIQGAFLAQSGDPQRGIELMRSTYAAVEHTNRSTLHLGHLAAAHAALGQLDVGLDLLDQALQTAETTSERFFEAELYRLRGKMLLTSGRRAEGEAALQQALTIARQQQAPWWELRAATTLAEHWSEQGKYQEAHALLQPVYSWFSEGFGTTSLKDAKALLDRLNELRTPSPPPAQAGRE
jgi:predicted ATPase